MSSKEKLDTLKPHKHVQRPHHQIKRSLSELSPLRLPRHSHDQADQHSHHHRYRSKRHHHDRDDLDAVSASPMSQYPRASIEAARSEGARSPFPAVGRDQRLSSLSSGPDDMLSVNGKQQLSIRREEQLLREREKMAYRITGLRESLVDLHDFSATTTRRLDDTYYAVLKKLGTLQSTIASLKELADDSQKLQASFKAESDEIAKDIGSQLDTFGQFDEQQERIEGLQRRIQVGRDRAQVLSDRVHVVQKRINGWKNADEEWQERVRKRLKVIWVIMSSLVFVLVCLFFLEKYAPGSMDSSSSLVTNLATGKNDGRPPLDEISGNSSKSAEALTDEVREELNKRRGDGVAEEALLRAFDEL